MIFSNDNIHLFESLRVFWLAYGSLEAFPSFLPLLLCDLHFCSSFLFFYLFTLYLSRSAVRSILPLCLITSFSAQLYKERPLLYSSSEQNPIFYLSWLNFAAQRLYLLQNRTIPSVYHELSHCFQNHDVLTESISSGDTQTLKLKNFWVKTGFCSWLDWCKRAITAKTMELHKCKSPVKSASNYLIFHLFPYGLHLF